MLYNDHVISNELDLMGQNLKNLNILNEHTTTKEKYKETFDILNLHCNLLENLNGLPHYIYLKEINLSSNNFITCNLPELSYLPILESLDLSGNKIESLRLLPFLPTIKNFSIAFNFIYTLNNIQDSIPNVINVDVRGNLISKYEDLLPICELKKCKELLLAGSQPNPICKNVPAILDLFNNSSSISLIDKKGKSDWNLSYGLFQVPTPHFDKILNKFRIGKTKQFQLFSPINNNNNNNSNIISYIHTREEFNKHHYNEYENNENDQDNILIDNQLFGNEEMKKPNKLLNISNISQITIPSINNDQIYDNNQNANYNNIINNNDNINNNIMNESENKLINIQDTCINKTTVKDMNTSAMSISYKNEDIQDIKLLHIKYIMMLYNQKHEKYNSLLIYQAWNIWKLNLYHNKYNDIITIKSNELISLENKNQSELQHQLQVEVRGMRLEHENNMITCKQQYDKLYSKSIQQETLLNTYKHSVENQQEKYQKLVHDSKDQYNKLQIQYNELEMKHNELLLQNIHEESEKDTKTLQDIERKDIFIQELESKIFYFTNDNEKLQLELNYCQQRLLENDEKIIQLKDKIINLNKINNDLNSDIKLKSMEIHSYQLNKQQQNQSLDNTILEYREQLNKATLQIDAYRSKDTLHNEVRDKLEQRLKKLQSAFEELSQGNQQLNNENKHLLNNHEKDIKTIKELSKCIKQLQDVLSKQQAIKCKKCPNLEEHNLKLQSELTSTQYNLNLKEQQLVELEPKYKKYHLLSEELHENNSILKRQFQQLEIQYQQNQDELLQNISIKSQNEINIKKLETNIKVKDALLEDQSIELYELRSKINNYQHNQHNYESDRDRFSQELVEKQEVLYQLENEMNKKNDMITKLKSIIKQYNQQLIKDNDDNNVYSNTTNTTNINNNNNNTDNNNNNNDDDDNIDELNVSWDFIGDKDKSPPKTLKDIKSLKSQKDTTVLSTVCMNEKCYYDKQQLLHDIQQKDILLVEAKREYEKLNQLKLEESNKFTTALTKLEQNSIELGQNIKNEKEKFELNITKYKKDIKHLKKTCHQLEDIIKQKENELKQVKVASEQIHSAFLNFQKIGNI